MLPPHHAKPPHGSCVGRLQGAKVVEKFTAHYVFALGLSRFVSCAHWILQILDGDSFLLKAMGSGLWPAMVLLSEIVQTFILADFWCGASTDHFLHDAVSSDHALNLDLQPTQLSYWNTALQHAIHCCLLC